MRRVLRFFLHFGLAAVVLGICGCAHRPAPPAPLPPVSPLAHKARTLLILIPQTDDAAATWLRLFTKHPRLRMVIALSPGFRRLVKDPALRAQIDALQKAGRLELAIQLPNAPFLPLLQDTDSARDATPPGTPLPKPAFSYPDDIVQIVARAKVDYFHAWNQLPKGLVLPHGAANGKLLQAFDRLGFAWLGAALGAPAVDGPYQYGSFLIWDGTPAGKPVGTTVHVWDERAMGSGYATAIAGWVQEADTKNWDYLLPYSDTLAAPALPDEKTWARRTWAEKDWSKWIGNPAKNAAWEWLRRTRQALEAFKNSGQASVKRLDMAFEQIYLAENSNFFAAIGNPSLSAPASDERIQEFQATLSTVYKLIGQTPPDDLFSTGTTALTAAPAATSTALAETLPDGRDHVVIEDPAGDDKGGGQLPEPAGSPAPGLYDLKRLELTASPQEVEWTITFGAPVGSLGSPQGSGPLIDIYIDLNAQPNVGTVSLLPSRAVSAVATDAWEYAFTLTGKKALFYRTQGGGSYSLEGSFPLTISGNQVQFMIPRSALRGNPRRWAYQALMMSYDPGSTAQSPRPVNAAPPGRNAPPIYDLLDPAGIPQAQLFSDIESGERSDIPSVRPRSK